MAKGKEAAAPPRADGALEMRASRHEMHGGKKRVRSIRTKRAKGGGHVVTHEFDHIGGNYQPDEDHVFGADEGVKHVQHYIRHAGVKGVKVSAAGDKDGGASGDASDAAE
jgi:hypothetical protein